MSDFTLSYDYTNDYNNKIELDIRLTVAPNEEDYKCMLDCIENLKELSDKYLSDKKQEAKESK